MSATLPPTQPTCPPPAARRSPCAEGRLQVPATPIIPFIEGDGTGPDIWRAPSTSSTARWSGPTAAARGSPGSRCWPAKRPRTG